LNVSALSPSELRDRLRDGSFRFRVGPFVTQVRTGLSSVVRSLGFFYGDYPLEDDSTIADFHVRLAPPLGPRRFYRRQVLFFQDGRSQFQPFPQSLAPPLFEWGLNWCVSNRAYQYLIVHAGVVERGGRALLLPARPGSGKSTLTAGLVHRGFRLLSDEQALIRPEDGRIVPVPRPIALKNESIAVVKALGPELVFGPTFHDTQKGDVTHLRALEDSVKRAAETALPGFVVFPKFVRGGSHVLEPVAKAAAMMELVDNSINYGILGSVGYRALTRLVDEAVCLALDYEDLSRALDGLKHLLDGTP
jgi:HprK-related kinase A